MSNNTIDNNQGLNEDILIDLDQLKAQKPSLDRIISLDAQIEQNKHRKLKQKIKS